MSGLLLVIIGSALLLLGYIFYGRWLCKQWGVGEGGETPAHTMEDGVDYVPAKAAVLMGHHFSSIAGAGPITGPISAAGSGFGWLACSLWIVIGGIFFGGVHDFGALFASVRHGGKSIGEIISANMSVRAKRLFIIFAYLTLILVVAAFASIVAGTFGATYTEAGALDKVASTANAQVAMVSLLFILIAIIFGFCVYRKNAPIGIASVVGVIAIAVIIVIGLNFHPIYLSTTAWMWICGAYILVASVTPVWILLQPRDYLSSFLLYAMLALAIIGVVIGNPSLDTMPVLNKVGNTVPVFPVLFTTIACGAISGFHSLVGSGTTSKQLDKETDAKPIAYGGMLIECALAIISLCACGFVWEEYVGGMRTPTTVFATGLSKMVATIPGLEATQTTISALLILAVSTFCLTSLDTATRLARYMFQEFWLKPGETYKDVTDFRKTLCNPFVATLITVIIGISLGLGGYSKIWPLFGAANQLLAALALLAVASWLGNIGRNNKMFMFPMAFMLVMTLWSLTLTIKAKLGAVMAGNGDAGAYLQLFFGIVLFVLAIVLTIEGVQTIKKASEKKA